MGGKTVNDVAEMLRRAMLCAGCAAIVLASAAMAAAEEPVRAVTLRVTWGGGRPAARTGRIEVVVPGTKPMAPNWRILSDEPNAPATMHEAGGAIEIHEPRGLDLNGVELRLTDWRQARLKVAIARREAAEEPVVFEGSVVELLAAAVSQPLDRDANRLSIGRAPGDELGIVFAAGESAIGRPGGTVTLIAHPLLAAQAAGGAYELKVGARRSGSATESHTQSLVVEEAMSGIPGVRAFRPLRLAVPLPVEEGGCDIDLQLVERGSLRWSRPVASRTIQVVAVAAERSATPEADWKLMYELDPGSPKLLDRLRRLPGMGLPTLPMAGVPLPKLPRPSFTLPKVAIPTPTLPNVPLPNVSLPGVPVPKIPSVTSMVPRMTGLLAVGHSTLESHALGPMLRLPPAADGPAWEGVALPTGVLGMPHLIEVEYPLEQEMMLGLSVLEEADGDVRATATSGIDLPAPVVDDGSRRGRIGTRRFVFWPRTRSPLLVITNLSERSPAVFGRVRLLAGPTRVADRQPPVAAVRRAYLHLPTPDFTPFGAVGRPAAAGGRAAADWDGFLGGIRRSADWALAQGAVGALVGVYADGAALWPTTLTHRAPRWDTGGGFDGRLDPEPKDVLGLLCRVYAREQLRLVPAVTCDGPVPILDGVVAQGGPEAAGIVAVGRDGVALVTDGGRCPHYNILDPRVQAAVEGLLQELVERVRVAPAVDGIAVLLPHDGWLHLPGVAAGLDDATFARFAAEAGSEVESLVRPALAAADPRRFAARAALVEGPLRDRWLAWREMQMADFHGRLAALVTAGRPTWTLHVMPTTLFVAGRLADRFRPHLADEPRDAEVLREVGLDPMRLTAHPGLVYVGPHAHVAADGGDRGVAFQANRALTLLRGTASATRTGVLLLEQARPLEVRDVAGQAGFSAKPSGPVPVVAPAGSTEARRALAEALIATDPEVVFDAGLLHTCMDEEDERSRLAVMGLPAPPLDVVAAVPAPLIVRVREGEAGLWMSLVNACGIACQAAIEPAQPPLAVADAVTKVALPTGPGGEVTVPLGPWEVRTILLEGCERIAKVRAVHAPAVAAAATALLDDLERRRHVLEMPAPLAVLDNPSFELPELGGVVPGWELVEAGRGTLRRVTGKPSAGGSGLAFASENGLATLRSNPFAAPATGRISVAVWVRAGGPDLQPPLRIALEGLQHDREFYRFAPVGRGTGAMPLSAAWSQFVLQIDDLPTSGLESLRVRLDLLGPGAVEIDDVRVFDLAFDESQRVRLSRILAVAMERAAAGDVGGCLVELDGPWPRFLRTHVGVPDALTAGREPASAAASPGAAGGQPARSGVVDRVRRWWQ